MRRKAVGLLICGALISAFSAASAENDNDNKFDSVDALLGKLITSSKGEVSAVQKKKPVTTPAKAIEHEEPEVVHHASVPSIGEPQADVVPEPKESAPSDVLLHRLTELPPGSKFEFTRTLFLPAYKQGVYFIDGEERYQIEKDSDIPKLLLSQPGKRDCAMTSNKNNIKMTGNTSGRRATFLEVEKVSILKKTDIDNVSLVRIGFKPKRPAAVDVSIHVEIICKVPAGNYHSLTLADINSGTGGLFDFELPRFIEL